MLFRSGATANPWLSAEARAHPQGLHSSALLCPTGHEELAHARRSTGVLAEPEGVDQDPTAPQRAGVRLSLVRQVGTDRLSRQPMMLGRKLAEDRPQSLPA